MVHSAYFEGVGVRNILDAVLGGCLLELDLKSQREKPRKMFTSKLEQIHMFKTLSLLCPEGLSLAV